MLVYVNVYFITSFHFSWQWNKVFLSYLGSILENGLATIVDAEGSLSPDREKLNLP